MPNTSGLNLPAGQGIDKMKEALSGGNYIDKLRLGQSITAGDALINQFDTDDQEVKESRGYLESTNGGQTVNSAPSQFNPFNVFRYKRFGASKDSYEIGNHLDSNLYGGDIGGLNEDEDRSKANIFAYIKDAISEPSVTPFNIGDFQKTTRNPSAKQIIDASRLDPEKNIVGPAPYAYNDFLYCKHYGKIPNNRLVTLRRYPQPVDDTLKIISKENNSDYIPVPLAQALTYYGNGTENSLKNVLPISWDMKWKELESKVQDIKGNEILVDDVLTAAGITDETTQNFIRATVAALQGGGDRAALQIAGYDAKLQKYIEDSYGPSGPYWNRVLGPVNVINKTRIRDRGMGNTMFATPVKLKFTFALRSFNFINPKVAMLDLISNFLSLTYNTAPFWGGGYRYFQNPGVTVGLAGSDLINEGKVLEGIQKTLEGWLNGAKGNFKDVIDKLGAAFKSQTGEETEATKDIKLEKDASGRLKTGARDLANAGLAGRAASLMQSPLTYRSLLEGRPVGEWHMTVGNPLDPFAVMGNLICTDCTMEFSEELGADDFPKEISFNVTLTHGKQRAKQDIESIFNLGGGPLSFSRLNPPSSAGNTFTDKGVDATTPPQGTTGNTNSNNDASTDQAGVKLTNGQEIEETNVIAEVGTSIYASRVSNHYGSKYASSSMLADYIKKSRS